MGKLDTKHAELVKKYPDERVLITQCLWAVEDYQFIKQAGNVDSIYDYVLTRVAHLLPPPAWYNWLKIWLMKRLIKFFIEELLKELNEVDKTIS